MRAVSTILTVSLLALAAPSLAGQPHTDGGKDPAIAVSLAWLCPGCGHLYTGETTKGAVIAAVAFGSVATGTVLQMRSFSRAGGDLDDCRFRGSLDGCKGSATPDLTPILVGGAIGIAAWAYGLIDARASARRANERRVEVEEAAAPSIEPVVGIDGSVGARVSVPLGGW